LIDRTEHTLAFKAALDQYVLKPQRRHTFAEESIHLAAQEERDRLIDALGSYL